MKGEFLKINKQKKNVVVVGGLRVLPIEEIYEPVEVRREKDKNMSILFYFIIISILVLVLYLIFVSHALPFQN